MAEALPEHQAGLRLYRIISIILRAGQWRPSCQPKLSALMSNSNYMTQMDVKCAQWYSTVVTAIHFSKKAQSAQFPDTFLLKKINQVMP